MNEYLIIVAIDAKIIVVLSVRLTVDVLRIMMEPWLGFVLNHVGIHFFIWLRLEVIEQFTLNLVAGVRLDPEVLLH